MTSVGLRRYRPFMSESERQRRAFEQWERENPEPATAPPGWYPHPTMIDTQRYWDGERWTDHIAPAQHSRSPVMLNGPKPVDLEYIRTTSTLETAGWFGALFFAPVGIVLGIILLTRDGPNKGGWILGVSCVWILLVVSWYSSQPGVY